MSFGRIALAWAAVAAWLVAWEWAARRGRLRGREHWDPAGEALLVTLLGALWFASLGAGAWWLPFLLIGALREWPIRSARDAARVGRMVAAGALLAWSLPS